MVSDCGRVVRLKDGKMRRELKAFMVHGYPTVELYVNGWGRTVPLHRLVVETFRRPLRVGEIVHHMNEDRGDPRLTNLHICTHYENLACPPIKYTVRPFFHRQISLENS